MITPCDTGWTRRWGWWCYAHNKPAYQSHDGKYYCTRANDAQSARTSEGT